MPSTTISDQLHEMTASTRSASANPVASLPKSLPPAPPDKIPWSPEAYREPNWLPELGDCRTCGGMKAVTRNVPPDHPDFGKSFPCPTCQGGRDAQQQRLERLFKTAGLKTKHVAFSLVDFDTLMAWEMEGKEGAIAAAKLWAEGAAMTYNELGIEDLSGSDDYARRSLVFYGPAGTGKTTLAAAALKERIAREGAGLMVEFYDLMNAIQAAYSSEGDESSALLMAAQDAPLLMLDDLGDPDRGNHSNRARFAETDDKRLKLYNIVNRRCKMNAPTIFTTNLTPDEVQIQFGESGRIRQRLEEMALWIPVSGPELRPGVRR